MIAPAAFEPVRRLFDEALADELGARFTLCIEGEAVLDLWGGFADRERTRPFGPDTLTPVFSTGKAVVALMVARLVGQGRLDYGQTVASVWPEFAAAGKGAITVGQLMSHQAGLAGFPDEIDPAEWFDWDAICSRLAALAPLWPPGSASGYHPITFGYLAGEVFRRVDGRTIGRALREDLGQPFGLDLWIGTPDSEVPRIARMERPHTMANLGKLDAIKRAAFLTRWAAPRAGAEDAGRWRRAEIPAANLHATAEALARALSVFANAGRLDGREVAAPAAVAEAMRERIFGRDLVLPFDLGWGAGLMRNPPNFVYGPGEEMVGHSGWGGSCAFADPERRLSGAYVMNKQSPALIGDPRPVRLIQAAYDCLEGR